MDKNEIHALISLLEDPDYNIYFQVKNKLVELGIEVIPDLENAWEMNFDSLIQSRAEQIIHEIQFNFTQSELKNWITSPEKNLLKAWLLLSRYQYPDLDLESIALQIEQIAKEIWMELNDNLTPLEKTSLINHILFEVYEYKGNVRNFHSPQNSFISDVLNNKKGSPLSISLLYLIIAQKCELPIKGVNLPKHFVIAYTNEELYGGDPVKFYINPFSQGTILSRQDLERFLKKEKIELKTKFFSPCGNRAIIRRLLTNLLHSYSIQGNKEKAEEIQKFLQLF
tara:strand:+ start:36 stop:881 length:846 start_codon:yes stop_codon:yes gene_type:complete